MQAKAERVCHEMAPPALAGVYSPMFCTRVVAKGGTHNGEHKAHKTIHRVGRVTVTWKAN